MNTASCWRLGEIVVFSPLALPRSFVHWSLCLSHIRELKFAELSFLLIPFRHLYGSHESFSLLSLTKHWLQNRKKIFLKSRYMWFARRMDHLLPRWKYFELSFLTFRFFVDRVINALVCPDLAIQLKRLLYSFKIELLLNDPPMFWFAAVDGFVKLFDWF